jgi:hypothetical protein
MLVIIAIIPAAMTFLALKVATVISQELKDRQVLLILLY